MTLTMKERYARLDTSKLPEVFNERFNSIKAKTDNFSDEDVLDIWEKPFDALYGIVEAKHPGAIRKGGTVTKEKPARVKVVKKKEPEAKVEVPASLRKKLSAKTIEQIEAAIWEANYANKLHRESDTALTESLMKDFGLSKGQAEKWVAKREVIGTVIGTGYDYSSRTDIKKAARKGKDEKTTRDGHSFNRKDAGMKGKKFFDEKGEQWTCLGYNAKTDDCDMENADGKKAGFCLESMYVHNPVAKREKGDMVDECRETLKEAGYTIKVHSTGTKKIKRSEPRPEKIIIKERVEDTFTPIMKDLKGSEEKEKENKATIEILESIQGLFSKFMNRISNLADDGKIEQLKKIEKLLKEIVD